MTLTKLKRVLVQSLYCVTGYTICSLINFSLDCGVMEVQEQQGGLKLNGPGSEPTQHEFIIFNKDAGTFR
jgi:hypothetical protein